MTQFSNVPSDPSIGDPADRRIQVAIAIIHHDERFLLQLRDEIPTIAYPGCWGLFGGHIEPGETPEAAIARELLEEITYSIPAAQKFGISANEQVIRHIFVVPLLVDLSDLKLQEGWDMALLAPEDIRRGDRFSRQANQTKPIGVAHQQILLDFIKQSHQTATVQ
jgi:8-oxo-dGTP diphosphatase